MFTALCSLSAPGTLVFGYRRGDEVPESVVEDWGLAEGEHYRVGPLDPDESIEAVMARPGDEANRATWEQWAVAHGMSESDAATAALEDLQAAGPSARPADGASKADWVLYVNDHPEATDEDQAWAGDKSTTKADLQAWQPARPGDTVAVAASEAQAQG